MAVRRYGARAGSAPNPRRRALAAHDMVEVRHHPQLTCPGGTMPASSDDSGTSESGANEDLKAKMREALERKKQGGAKGLHGDNPLRRRRTAPRSPAAPRRRCTAARPAAGVPDGRTADRSAGRPRRAASTTHCGPSSTSTASTVECAGPGEVRRSWRCPPRSREAARPEAPPSRTRPRDLDASGAGRSGRHSTGEPPLAIAVKEGHVLRVVGARVRFPTFPRGGRPRHDGRHAVRPQL